MRIVLAGGIGADRRDPQARASPTTTSSCSRAPATCAGTGGRSAPWAARSSGADALINLAGRTVDCRYTPANRRAIMDSRLESTHVLREAIAQRRRPAARLAAVEHGDDLRRHLRPAPTTRTACSAATSRTCRTPGASASTSPAAGRRRPRGAAARTVLLRSAMVMSPDRGGVFDTLRDARPARPRRPRAAAGASSSPGSTTSTSPRAVRLLIEREDLAGPVNLAAPNPLPVRRVHGARCARPRASGSGCRRRAGCSRPARSSCAPRPSSCSRAAASSRAACSTPASSSGIPDVARGRAGSRRDAAERGDRRRRRRPRGPRPATRSARPGGRASAAAPSGAKKSS